MQGDFQHISVLEEIYDRLKRRPRNDQELNPPPQESINDDNDDDDEDTENNEAEDDAEAMDVEASRANNGPIIDEDGFQLVQGKGRRRGR